MFSQKIKELRLEKGLTQKQIAEELNISQQAYQAWEKGKRQPTIPTIELFAKYFNVPIEQLLSNPTLSLDALLQSDTITYQGQNLSEDKMLELKGLLLEFVEKL